MPHARRCQPHVPTAPQAVQKSQPSLRIIVWLPHSLHSLPWVGCTVLLASSGAFGWINADGRADLGVVIRSLMHTSHGWELGTGGGVTVRSDVLEEWEETRWKAARLTAALDL